jgi:hypothetical protein
MSIKRILEEAKLNNSLVSIYSEPEHWNQFSVGYVDLITDTHIRIKSLSRFGSACGYEVRLISEIFRVESDGKYEQKIEKLSQNQKRIFHEVQLPHQVNLDLIRDTLQQALDESVIVVIWGSHPDDSLVGYVKKVDSEVVSLHLINEFGEDDGVSSIQISRVGWVTGLSLPT